MMSDTMRTSRVVALAVVVGSFFVAQEILIDLVAGKRANIAPRAVVALCFWLAWACLTPAVRIALRRWPLGTRPAYRPLLVQGAVSVVLAAVQSAIALSLQAVALYLQGGVGIVEVLRRHASAVPFTWGAFTALVAYWVIVMVFTALRFRGLYAAGQASAAALEAELQRAKLETLRSQLRPHFLFNTLNAISVFVTEDADKAQLMLLRLSTLLRRSLDEEANEVPLRQELAFANDYLDIQRGRFGDELIVRLDIDPAVLDARVPVFLLQPLLENAIEHGKSDETYTTIALRAGREHDTLRITLSDNGPGVGGSVPVREGIGLRNTRARLLHLYGPGATVDLGAAEPGARVEIRLPYRQSPR